MNVFARKFLTILLLLLVPGLRAQTLSFDDLFDLQGQDLSDVNETLVNKGWKLQKTSDGDSVSYGVATWYAKRSKTDPDISFFRLYFAPGRYSRAAYIFRDKNVHDEFVAKIKRRGMEKLGSGTSENMIIANFADSQYVVSVSYLADPQDDETYYTFLVFDRRDFERMAKGK